MGGAEGVGGARDGRKERERLLKERLNDEVCSRGPAGSGEHISIKMANSRRCK